jgi:hypothetical protein
MLLLLSLLCGRRLGRRVPRPWHLHQQRRRRQQRQQLLDEGSPRQGGRDGTGRDVWAQVGGSAGGRESEAATGEQGRKEGRKEGRKGGRKGGSRMPRSLWLRKRSAGLPVPSRGRLFSNKGRNAGARVKNGAKSRAAAMLSRGWCPTRRRAAARGKPRAPPVPGPILLSIRADARPLDPEPLPGARANGADDAPRVSTHLHVGRGSLEVREQGGAPRVEAYTSARTPRRNRNRKSPRASPPRAFNAYAVARAPQLTASSPLIHPLTRRVYICLRCLAAPLLLAC